MNDFMTNKIAGICFSIAFGLAIVGCEGSKSSKRSTVKSDDKLAMSEASGEGDMGGSTGEIGSGGRPTGETSETASIDIEPCLCKAFTSDGRKCTNLTNSGKSIMWEEDVPKGDWKRCADLTTKNIEVDGMVDNNQVKCIVHDCALASQRPLE